MNERDKNEERYADPEADEDPRTSDHGRTSIGATDLNAGNATVPEDTPGVRSGDADSPTAPRVAPSTNDDLGDDITQPKT
jgi:hypothetical protein